MLQVSDLHRQAENRLQSVSDNPKRLVLLHSAIALGSSLLLMFFSYLFSLGIADTGGLGGLGVRSILTTAQSVLEFVVMVALPFWQVGIFYVALQWVEGEQSEFRSLFQGFRRFGSVLGFLFLRNGLFIALALPLFYISTAVFMMTPYATPVLELFAPILEQGATPEVLETLFTPELVDSASQSLIPLFIIFCLLYLIIAIPVFYRIRFANFALMDGQSAGRSLLKSLFITRKRSWQVFRLDLSFWWFYLLQALSVAVCYADEILPAIGVALPVSGVGVTLGCYALGCICQCVLLWLWEGQRLTAYALAYRSMEEENDPKIVNAQA